MDSMDEDIIHIFFKGIFIDSKAACCISLGIKVHKEDSRSRVCKTGCKVDTCCCLTDTPLLVGDGNDLRHDIFSLLIHRFTSYSITNYIIKGKNPCSPCPFFWMFHVKHSPNSHVLKAFPLGHHRSPFLFLPKRKARGLKKQNRFLPRIHRIPPSGAIPEDQHLVMDRAFPSVWSHKASFLWILRQ